MASCRYQECVSHKADLKLGRKLKPDRMEARANCDQVTVFWHYY